PALDGRDDREVICRRRRSRGPLQSPRVPGIAACCLATQVRPKQVEDQNQYPKSLQQRANGHNKIQGLPTPSRLVRINPARHSQEARNMHHIEREMKSDEEKPEMKLAESLVVQFSRHLWKPVIESGKDIEDNGANDHIVKMRHDEVRMTKLPIERRRGQHDSGQSRE